MTTGRELVAPVTLFLTDKDTFIDYFAAAYITIRFRIYIENVKQDEIKSATARNRGVTRASYTDPLKTRWPNKGKTT